MFESSVITNLPRVDGRARRESDLPSRTTSTYGADALVQAVLPMTPQQVAAAENRAARLSWGLDPDCNAYKPKNVPEHVREYIGSGLSTREVASRIGCAPQSVNAALRKIGGKL